MHFIPQILFVLLTGAAVFLFWRNISRIRRNINLGRELHRSDRKPERWANMSRVAMGQSKMVVRPVAGFFHILIYVGFILINIEVLEIMIDGLLGTHRVFQPILGTVYNVAIGFFELLGLLVMIACIAFLYRRYAQRIPRFQHSDLKGFPQKDASAILISELILMTALFIMNAADQEFQANSAMPISFLMAPLFENMSPQAAHAWVMGAWWFHLAGILAFLNYLPYSKHFHIIMAFPNTWYVNLDPMGKLSNNATVTNEVKLMMDPSLPPPEVSGEPQTFGAKDVNDLSWKSLMDAYSCTECGRCTSVCPANITGKLLSPRLIMMKTRDRLEEVGKLLDQKQEAFGGEKNLHSSISAEELWACTTCNACTQACPVDIAPVDIIMEMRRYLVMEQSAAPNELNLMMNNTENNGAPWQYAQSARFDWSN